MTLKDEEKQEMSMLYIDKAHQAIQDAENNKNNSPNLTVSRCYYSMFYAAQSILILEGIANLHRHEGVNVKFSELFVRTGEFSKDVFRTMGRTERDRYEADYNPKKHFTTKETEEYISSAKIFVNHVEKMIEKRLSNEKTHDIAQREAEAQLEKRGLSGKVYFVREQEVYKNDIVSETEGALIQLAENESVRIHWKEYFPVADLKEIEKQLRVGKEVPVKIVTGKVGEKSKVTIISTGQEMEQ